MSRVAVTIWNDRISPVFESAGTIMVIEMVENRETSRSELDFRIFNSNDGGRGRYDRFYSPQFGGGLVCKKVERLRELGIDLLVCGAISNFAERLVNSAGIEVFGWVSGNKEEVIAALRGNKIGNADFLMPGCGRRGNRGRGGHGRGRLRHGGNFF